MFALLTPKALFLLAAAVPLVLLYVLKTRRTKVKVSSAALFVLARREATARDPWKRLRPELALLLQLLALILLAVAFARPVSKSAGLDADALVIVIDRSASMATKSTPMPGDKGVMTRLARAKLEARKLIDDVGLGAEVAIVVAGRDARVMAALVRDDRAAKKAVAGIEPGLVEGQLEPALDVARDLLRHRSGKRRVVVLSDLALAAPTTWLDEEGGPTLDLRTIDPANPGIAPETVREGNVGILRVDARRFQHSSGADRVEVAVTLGSFGKVPFGPLRYVTLRRIDRPTALDAQKIEIGRDGLVRASVTLGFFPATDGSDEMATLTIELSPQDSLPLDDFAQVVVPPPRRMDVVLASLGVGGANWIARALASDPDVNLLKVGTAELGIAVIPPWALVVITDACPKIVPGGGDVLVVNPPAGECAGRVIGDERKAGKVPPITSWSPTDPRLRFVDLDGLRFGRIVPIAPLGGDPDQGAALLGSASLVRAEQFSLIADASTLDRTITIWGFDPADSDLPRKASFVLLVRDAVDSARNRRDKSWAPSTRAGIAARVAAGPGATEVVAKRLGVPGEPGVGDIVARAPVLEGMALLEGLDRPGPYALEGAATRAPLTVSLLSEQESDVVHVVEPIRRQVAATSTIPGANKIADEAQKARARADLRWIVAAVAAIFLAFDALWLTHKGRRIVARLTRRSNLAPHLPKAGST